MAAHVSNFMGRQTAEGDALIAGRSTVQVPAISGDLRLPSSSRVKIKSNDDLDGTIATVQHYDEAAGRYTVRADATGATLALKPKNLTLVNAFTPASLGYDLMSRDGNLVYPRIGDMDAIIR